MDIIECDHACLFMLTRRRITLGKLGENMSLPRNTVSGTSDSWS